MTDLFNMPAGNYTMPLTVMLIVSMVAFITISALCGGRLLWARSWERRFREELDKVQRELGVEQSRHEELRRKLAQTQGGRENLANRIRDRRSEIVRLNYSRLEFIHEVGDPTAGQRRFRT